MKFAHFHGVQKNNFALLQFVVRARQTRDVLRG